MTDWLYGFQATIRQYIIGQEEERVSYLMGTREKDSMHVRETEEGTRERYSTQGSTANDLLPLVRSHLLKFLAPLNWGPSKHSTHESVGDISYSNCNRGCCYRNNSEFILIC
jgi:hypothetical protein